MLKALSCGVFLRILASAQTITSAGYLPPAPVSAAPGQILTFFADGIGTTGITAILHQGAAIPVSVIDVRSVPTCSGVLVPAQNTCGALTAVTVQIPYELSVLSALCKPRDSLYRASHPWERAICCNPAERGCRSDSRFDIVRYCL